MISSHAGFGERYFSCRRINMSSLNSRISLTKLFSERMGESDCGGERPRNCKKRLNH